MKQWRDFLAAKEMLPAVFASISIQADYGKEFRYRSPRLALAYPDKLMKVTEDSDLHVKFSYFKENDRVVWDASSVLAGESKDTSVLVVVSRHLRPPETLPDSDRRTWQALVQGRMPYTGTPFFDKSNTIIAKAYAPGSGAAALKTSPVLYSVTYSTEGTQDASAMEQRLAGFRTGITIKE